MEIFYLSGIFRCGNTLLRSIINQNPNFRVTPNSILPEVMFRLHLLKESVQYKEWYKVDVDDKYKDHTKRYDNIIKNIFNNYYEGYNEEYILDQGRWGTEYNFDMLKTYNFLPKKFIMLVRPLDEILKSWIRVNDIHKDHVENHIDSLMKPDGQVGMGILALENLLNNYSNHTLIVKYSDLCNYPESTIDRIYYFLGVPYFEHRFTNLNQVDGSTIHTRIRTDKIEVKDWNVSLPVNILEKYNYYYRLMESYG